MARPRSVESEAPEDHFPTAEERDERVSLHPLTAEEAWRRLLGLEPADQEERDDPER